MSERKVLSKYYPSDFDPSKLKRQKKRPNEAGAPKLQTVRIMAPFSMKCLTCAEYIYKGRKFNSRKETDPAERYLNIQIHRFHIRCTRCSAEIIFRTDPKNNDYAMVSGAMRNMEPWHNKEAAKETDQERLDRLEAENQEEDEGAADDPMQSLEAKTRNAQDEMAVADALDQIRMRNAARVRASAQAGEDLMVAEQTKAEEEEEQDRIDAEAARLAFAKFRSAPKVEVIVEEEEPTSSSTSEASKSVTDLTSKLGSMEAPKRPAKKKKKDYAAALGIKKKA